MEFTVEAIGRVEAARAEATDDFWGGSESRIVLADHLPEEALEGIDAFSHVEIIFVLDRTPLDSVVTGTRHPRGNTDWPKVGIFAQRGKSRPNRLGLTICRVLRREGRALVVAELDAIDGTPVLDLKPVLQEYLPRTPVHQPDWSSELMQAYWKTNEGLPS